MADGLFYVDHRAPFISADIGSVTIGAAYKALIPVAALPVLGANYFSFIGKAVRLRMFGRWTTAAAAGTQTMSLLWGTGADNSGNASPLLSTPVITPINSLVNTSWLWEAIVRCRVMGTSGSLMSTGTFKYLNSLTLTTAAVEYMLPVTAPAAVTADLSASNVISPQALATTSTTNTMQVHDFTFESLN